MRPPFARINEPLFLDQYQSSPAIDSRQSLLSVSLLPPLLVPGHLHPSPFPGATGQGRDSCRSFVEFNARQGKWIAECFVLLRKRETGQDRMHVSCSQILYCDSLLFCSLIRGEIKAGKPFFLLHHRLLAWSCDAGLPALQRVEQEEGLVGERKRRTGQEV